jgi:signal transduction histidine kinase
MSTFRLGLAGLATLSVASALVLGASNTGKRDYDRSNLVLSSAAWFENETEAAVLRLRSYLNDGFDYITSLQIASRDLLAALDSRQPDFDDLSAALRQDARLIDDFKAQHAIFRNSLYSFQRLIVDYRATGFLRGNAPYREPIGQLERAVLRYAFLGTLDESQTIDALTAAIEDDSAFAPVVESADWRFLKAHIDRIIDSTPLILKIDQERSALGVENRINAHIAAAEMSYTETAKRASYYLYALFALAVGLLTFAGFKISQVRRYVAVIEAHGVELENRVTERTADLAAANDQLKRDAAEREQMQEDLLQARKLESVGQLAAGIAHEINTPIQYVGDNLGFLENAFDDLRECLDGIKGAVLPSQAVTSEQITSLLDKADLEYLWDEAPKALAQSRDGVKRVSDIVHAMKTFAHQSNTMEDSDLNSAIKSSVIVTSNEWKFVADTVLELDESLPKVPCLLGEFNQVIVNMIVNAAHAIADTQSNSGADASTERGTITICSRHVADYVEIDIEDSGTGMDEATQARVFDPFFTTKEVGKGTGQGLMIAHRVIVDKHHGRIDIRSAPGSGTTFTIRLPLTIPDDART